MSIKNFIFIFFCCFLLVHPLYGNSLNSILKNKKLVVGIYYKDIFPFFFHSKTGELTGFDIDLAKDIAKNLGVKLIINREARSFDNLTDLVKDKKVDLIISWFSITLKRAKKIRFSKPYLYEKMKMIINRIRAAQIIGSIISMNNLNNKSVSICTVKNTAYVDFLKKFFPESKKIFLNSWNECYSKIKKEKIIAGLWTETEISYKLMQSPEDSIKLKQLNINQTDYIAIGINSENEMLEQWINIYLQLKNYKFTPEQVLNKYIEKYGFFRR